MLALQRHWPKSGRLGPSLQSMSAEETIKASPEACHVWRDQKEKGGLMHLVFLFFTTFMGFTFCLCCLFLISFAFAKKKRGEEFTTKEINAIAKAILLAAIALAWLIAVVLSYFV